RALLPTFRSVSNIATFWKVRVSQVQTYKRGIRQINRDSDVGMPTPEPRFYPAKKAVSALALLQLMLATVHYVENSLVLHRNYDDFYHAESRLVVAVVWAFTLCWILVTLTLLFGTITNRPPLLLPHIIFSCNNSVPSPYGPDAFIRQ
uniref:Uncharacterized protein n=1 Tax=Parascaris univalens TaxID=6257 RepID=A0A915AUX2_PARUN